MTNTQMLINSLNKANQEKMTIVKCGSQVNSGFVVINNDVAYNVKVDEDQKIVSCDCPHHVHRSAICKHMIKVSLNKNLNIINI